MSEVLVEILLTLRRMRGRSHIRENMAEFKRYVCPSVAEDEQ